MFYRVQSGLSGRMPSTAPRQRTHPDFPLRAFVRCESCGRGLAGSWSKGRSEYYAYYHCRPGCRAVPFADRTGWRITAASAQMSLGEGDTRTRLQVALERCRAVFVTEFDDDVRFPRSSCRGVRAMSGVVSRHTWRDIRGQTRVVATRPAPASQNVDEPLWKYHPGAEQQTECRPGIRKTLVDSV